MKDWLQNDKENQIPKRKKKSVHWCNTPEIITNTTQVQKSNTVVHTSNLKEPVKSALKTPKLGLSENVKSISKEDVSVKVEQEVKMDGAKEKSLGSTKVI